MKADRRVPIDPPDARRGGALGLAARYALFCVLAGVCNLATQELVIYQAPRLPIMAPILAGTVVGFAVKYVCDKLWIFDDPFGGSRGELRKIALYGAFSVLTTGVFWTIELASWTIWRTPEAREIGGAVGLTVGCWLKYLLDKHWTFATPQPVSTELRGRWR